MGAAPVSGIGNGREGGGYTDYFHLPVPCRSCALSREEEGEDVVEVRPQALVVAGGVFFDCSSPTGVQQGVPHSWFLVAPSQPLPPILRSPSQPASPSFPPSPRLSKDLPFSSRSPVASGLQQEAEAATERERPCVLASDCGDQADSAVPLPPTPTLSPLGLPTGSTSDATAADWQIACMTPTKGHNISRNVGPGEISPYRGGILCLFTPDSSPGKPLAECVARPGSQDEDDMQLQLAIAASLREPPPQHCVCTPHEPQTSRSARSPGKCVMSRFGQAAWPALTRLVM